MFGKKVILTVDGMACAHCGNRVQTALNALPGVKAKVDIAKKTVVVKGCDDKERLVQIVADLGFKVIE